MDNREYMYEDSPSQRTRGFGALEYIIAINVAVSLFWNLFIDGGPSEGLARDNLFFSNEALRVGKIWTLLTYAFCHADPFHLLLNMIVLFLFVRSLADEWGGRRFTLFYCACAIAGALFSAVLTALGLVTSEKVLGASGAVCGAATAVCMLRPRQTVLLFFAVPVPALVIPILFVATDVLGVVREIAGFPPVPGPRVAHGAHLGGALCGALYTMYVLGHIRLPGLRRPRRRRETVARREVRSMSQREFGRSEPGEDSINDRDEKRMDFLLQKVSSGGL
ncbi:MAG: rhomboid family intramembrane serine protease, partial [Planctomycetota bacterium]